MGVDITCLVDKNGQVYDYNKFKQDLYRFLYIKIQLKPNERNGSWTVKTKPDIMRH